ncbi:MAG: hypothetical protein ACM3JB_17750 [Acidobacteriaceae bacterium]
MVEPIRIVSLSIEESPHFAFEVEVRSPANQVEAAGNEKERETKAAPAEAPPDGIIHNQDNAIENGGL